MCGILGTTNTDITKEVFEKAFERIYKRGPDNQSYVTEDYFIFGHTRLSILDLDSRSNQPFFYNHLNDKVAIVFNGEIYNFIEIKKELQEKYNFSTTSDTEVVCAAYLEWGEDCFDRFEGMWALSIYGYQKDELILSRDRVGKKPLYYSYHNNQVYFSSSLWSVAIVSENKDISVEGFDLYIALGFTPDKYSIVQNVNKLEPGKILVYQRKGKEYFFSREKTSVYQNPNAKKNSVKKLIKQAVAKRLISDVPVATLMSGGVDSTIVTVLTKKQNKNIESFFVDFEDKKFSEAKWSNYLAKRNKIELTNVMLNSQELSHSFKNYTKVYEEPFADYSGIPSIGIFKIISEKYKVVLTGDGGDELFYGYPHYTKKTILYTFCKLNNYINVSKLLGGRAQKIIEGKPKDFEANYLKNHSIITPFAENYINNRFNNIIEKSGSFIRGIIQYDREFFNLPEKYLVKVDRASMFFGIEVRSPFLDEKLLAKIKSLNPFLLFTPFRKKLFPKIIYYKIFGIKYFFSKKQGFTPPIKHLREEHFTEKEFENLKLEIKNFNPNFYMLTKDLSFAEVLKDEIFFDRFFFFYLWFQYYSELLINISSNANL